MHMNMCIRKETRHLDKPNSIKQNSKQTVVCFLERTNSLQAPYEIGNQDFNTI